ncbi:hypothetical protein AOLI_G00039210 [Acnodon oligacanthus]
MVTLNRSPPPHLQRTLVSVEDGGDYRCSVTETHTFIKLTVEEDPTKTITSTAAVSVNTRTTTSILSSSSSFQTAEGTTPSQTASMKFYIFIPVLLLLLVVGGVFYWRYRGQRRGQMESREQRGRKEQDTQDQVTYSTLVHSNRTSSPTVMDTGDKTEYATIRMN